MKMFTAKKLCTIFLLLFFAFTAAGCENAPKEAESDAPQDASAESSFESLPPLTPEYAAEIAERLIREQEDPEYIYALEVYAQDRLEEAEKLFKPLVDAGNTMAMTYYVICLKINHGLSAYNEYSSILFKAATLGNPIAMWDLNRYGFSMGEYSRLSDENWSDRMVEYWRIRSEAGDAEAMFCLSRALLKDGTDYLAKSAYLGHPPALFIINTKKDFEWFCEFYSSHPEMPGWRDVVLGKLKELADAGNPVAQCNYGTITEDQSYWEKSADQGYRDAMARLVSRNTCHIEVKYKDVLKGVYHMFQMRLLDKNPIDFVEDEQRLSYRDEKNRRKDLAREEYETLLAKAKEWHKTHPYYYVYLHPLHRFE